MTTKYDIAANVEIAELDGKTLRMTARQQREVFGAAIFGKKQIRIDNSGQGTVYVTESCFEGTHTSYSEQPVTYEQVSLKVRRFLEDAALKDQRIAA